MAATCDSASQPAASDAAYTLSCSSRQPVLRPSMCMARTVPMRSITWFFTLTRMSRGISDKPRGAACAYAGSM